VEARGRIQPSRLQAGLLDRLDRLEPHDHAPGGDALEKTWIIARPHAPLAGTAHRIAGLETTITDVLLRVVHDDGSELTRVLRPRRAR
jgi:hypothetical protein